MELTTLLTSKRELNTAFHNFPSSQEPVLSQTQTSYSQSSRILKYHHHCAALISCKGIFILSPVSSSVKTLLILPLSREDGAKCRSCARLIAAAQTSMAARVSTATKKDMVQVRHSNSLVTQRRIAPDDRDHCFHL